VVLLYFNQELNVMANNSSPADQMNDLALELNGYKEEVKRELYMKCPMVQTLDDLTGDMPLGAAIKEKYGSIKEFMFNCEMDKMIVDVLLFHIYFLTFSCILETMRTQVVGLDDRTTRVEEKIDELKGAINGVTETLTERIDRRLARLENSFATRLRSLEGRIANSEARIIESTSSDTQLLVRQIENLKFNFGRDIRAEIQVVNTNIQSLKVNLTDTIVSNISNVLTKIEESKTEITTSIRNYTDLILVAVNDLETRFSAYLDLKVTAILGRIDTVIHSINEIGQNLTALINQKFEAISTQISLIKPEIEAILQTNLEEIITLINRVQATLTSHLDRGFSQVNASITRIEENITTILRRRFDSLEQLINAFDTKVTDILDTNFRNLFSAFNSLYDSIRFIRRDLTLALERLFSIQGTLNAIAAAVVGLETTLVEFQVSVTGYFAFLIGGVAELNLLLVALSSEVGTIPANTSSVIKPWVSKLIKPIPEETSEQVACKIVGTTYYRWDLDTNYSPTLMFLFEEKKEGIPKRQTQIKAKLPYSTESLPIDIIETLRISLKKEGPISYSRGPLRASFVHPSRKWKTTLFVQHKNDAKKIMTYIFSILGIPPAIDGLSYTEGRNKFSPTKLVRHIPGIALRQDDPQEIFEVVLKRVVLLVNNSKNPTLIWKFEG
jgi:uncharacterized protein YicC (UPF0701 family)